MAYKQAFKYIFMVLIFTAGTNSFALSKHGYALDYVQGEGGVKGLKLAYQYHAPQLQSILKNSHIYLESSVNIWEYGAENKHQTNLVLAMSPVVQYPLGLIKNIPISIEAGIGFSLIDDTYFASKNVSTHYQFEDRFGFVAEFDEVTAALRYLHYSNAGFKRPNPGLDFISLSFAKRF